MRESSKPSRLSIGHRLLLCFACIVLTMVCGSAAVLWQFHVVRVQAERLSALDQKLVAVVRVHATLLAFRERLEELTESQDAGRLVAEARGLRDRVQEDFRRSRAALEALPPDVRRDPTILATLEVVESALAPQLDTIRDLAVLDDWGIVRLRLSNQVRPLEALTSALVEKAYEETVEDQTRAVRNTELVERPIALVVPTTAIATLLTALTLGLAVTRSITQPLARLVAGSRALAQGDFGHEVSITGRDELAHLGQVFMEATERLRDLYATLQSNPATGGVPGAARSEGVHPQTSSGSSSWTRPMAMRSASAPDSSASTGSSARARARSASRRPPPAGDTSSARSARWAA